MKIFILIFLSVLFSCANESLKPRVTENYYQSSGVEKYFLSEFPAWANFSESGACFRKNQIKYFDIDALMKSYGIKHSIAIQIQATFNDEYLRLTKTKESIVPFSEEQLLFFKASEKVNSKIVFFEAPTFKRVHLVWVDGAEPAKIKNFLKSSVHDSGVPVLISLCQTKSELEMLFSESNYKMLSAEMLSVFNDEGNKEPGFSLIINDFFKEGQELILYTPKKINELKELKGKYKIINY